MPWYPDLSTEDVSKFLNVGWLSSEHPFPQGEVTETEFEKLCELLVNPWNPAYPVGVHLCELCRFSGGNGVTRFKDFQIAGYSKFDLYVPGQGIIYVAPSSIAHSVDAHQYLPPRIFLDAVMACPPMRSVDYFRALLANGGRDLVRNLKDA
ncbi:hypothetical protein EON80_22345 [bacterium]|nr:MAG: hypothetical protein EON80_22345 [bacterium]